MKGLSIKAFWLTLSGLFASLAYRAVDVILSRGREFTALAKRLDEQQLERLATALFRLNVITAIIFALICSYFIYRLFANRREPQGQKYITFLYVVCIIFAAFNALSLILGNWLALVSLAINALIIAGCVIQRAYEQKAG